MLRLKWNKCVPKRDAFVAMRSEACRGGVPPNTHLHCDFAEVFWIEEGEAIHVINGKRLPLTRGTLVMVRPGDIHGFCAEKGARYTLVWTSIPQETLAFLRKRYFAGEDRFFWASSRLPFEWTLDADHIRRMGEWADHLVKAPRTKLEIERFLIELMHELQARTRNAYPKSIPAWLSQALTSIREPRHFALGTRELARLAGRCPEHVTRQLKKHLQMTANDAVNQARLDYAAVQLRTSTKKILDLALECGFQSAGYFYQLFRKQFGVTPTAYRRRYQTLMQTSA